MYLYVPCMGGVSYSVGVVAPPTLCLAPSAFFLSRQVDDCVGFVGFQLTTSYTMFMQNWLLPMPLGIKKKIIDWMTGILTHQLSLKSPPSGPCALARQVKKNSIQDLQDLTANMGILDTMFRVQDWTESDSKIKAQNQGSTWSDDKIKVQVSWSTGSNEKHSCSGSNIRGIQIHSIQYSSRSKVYRSQHKAGFKMQYSYLWDPTAKWTNVGFNIHRILRRKRCSSLKILRMVQ